VHEPVLKSICQYSRERNTVFLGFHQSRFYHSVKNRGWISHAPILDTIHWKFDTGVAQRGVLKISTLAQQSSYEQRMIFPFHFGFKRKFSATTFLTSFEKEIGDFEKINSTRSEDR